jgi:histidinol-phosphate aminotransferase
MKNWINKVKRTEPENIDRSEYLRLDKNERVIDFSQFFLKKIKTKLNSFLITTYPNIEKIKLLISKKYKISKNNICLTAGSDFALRMCFEYFCNNNDKIITIEPTFGMVEVYSKIFNLKNIQIGYKKDLTLNLEKLNKSLNKNISMIIIANPNSPTGTIIEPDVMKKIIVKTNKLKIPLIIDEAYFGFYKKTYIEYVSKFNNLVVIRTFSKAFGMAGLRAGFIVCNKLISKNLFKFKPMYEINSLSCLVIETLLNNPKEVNNHIRTINDSKNFLIKQLKKMNYEYINTFANFFHINLKNKKKKFEKILKKNKILVRKGPGVKGYENYLRITVGSTSQMKRIIELLRSI